MPRISPWLAFAVLAILSGTYAEIYDDFQSANTKEYDFIIAGGGTAGLVVANRLSENPSVSVLVIEAGGSHENDLNLEVPFYCTRASPKTKYDWNYTTVAQPSLNSRVLDYNRGHVLGGSSTINFMMYTRGSSEDYDRIAHITGDPGWSWNKLKPFILKNEIVTPPTDNHNTTGEYDPSVHGLQGILSTSLPGFREPINDRTIQATQELSDEFPYNTDYNSGNQIGMGWALATTLNGARSSSATAFLAPKYASRPNLHVVLNTRVTRVLTKGKGPGPGKPSGLEIDGVEVAVSADGPRRQIRARKEVILSAGTVGSPHILMNSGIGDSQSLGKLGIKTLLHNPSVGRNMSDHPVLSNNFVVNETETWEAFTRDPAADAAQLELWKTKRQGPLVNVVGTHTGWFRIPDNSSIYQQYPDYSAGPHSAHYEFAIGNGFRGVPPPTGNYMVISTVVVSPAARGSIQLASNNPFADPIIDPNFMSNDFDMFVMRYAVKAARRFAAAKAWEGYVLGPYVNATTDEEIDAFIRNNTRTIYHPVGTAAMTAKNAGYGVVNPDLQVKGISGLRIVDASVFPYIPAAHTQAPVYIIAERGSQLIKDTWRL